MRLLPGIALLAFTAPLKAQHPGTHLTVDVAITSLVVRGDTVGITYVIHNRATSQDSLITFTVDAPALVKRIPTPEPDSDYLALGSYRGRPAATWTFGALLNPSATSVPLYFESVGIPDTVTSWAGGYFELPEAESAADTLPTDDPLHYNTVAGVTVGVKPWPVDRSARALLSRLRVLTQNSCGPTLLWVSSASLCTQLLSDIDRAESLRASGHPVQARASLKSFISAISGSSPGTFAANVTSAGYWLLRSNAGIIVNIL
jgi:hypothetical protein